MKVTFSDDDLQDFCMTGKSNKSAYKVYVKDRAFMSALARVISTFQAVPDCSRLKDISFLRYERLKYGYSGKSSVRIIKNRVERLIFIEKENGIEIQILELNSEHYGNKR